MSEIALNMNNVAPYYPGVVFWTPFYLCFNFCFKYASYNTAKTVVNRYSENCFNGVVSHENHAHHKTDIQ